eukprot:2157364-Prymnesium_polylepis.1
MQAACGHLDDAGRASQGEQHAAGRKHVLSPVFAVAQMPDECFAFLVKLAASASKCCAVSNEEQMISACVPHHGLLRCTRCVSESERTLNQSDSDTGVSHLSI